MIFLSLSLSLFEKEKIEQEKKKQSFFGFRIQQKSGNKRSPKSEKEQRKVFVQKSNLIPSMKFLKMIIFFFINHFFSSFQNSKPFFFIFPVSRPIFETNNYFPLLFLLSFPSISRSISSIWNITHSSTSHSGIFSSSTTFT